ncbi:MAG: DeoR/GlpR transcriptional regulator, partial [Oricola sp.]|nr:DeoR/GlpR transcriptional regulator [Oricola sp.]
TYFASKFFVGAQGINGEGLRESHPLMVKSIQELSRNVDQIVVLADSRKFSIQARSLALPLSRGGTLITEEGLTDQDAKMLEEAGVTIRIAGGRSIS